MDLGTILNNIRADGTLYTLANNVLLQFGVPTRRYLGATLLPEQNVDENMFREENIRYRTVIANDGARYASAQNKGGDLMGAFEVVLGDQDIARDFTGKQYDTMLRILGAGNSMGAVLSITNWAEVTLALALVELIEKQRWDAILNASVVRRGNNGFSETVSYPNPSGHRVNAGGQWSDDNYDPYDDITAMVNLLWARGYTVNRIITRRPVLSILAKNRNMRMRAGILTVNSSNELTAAPGLVQQAVLNEIFQKDGLPPFESYDLQYRVQSTDSSTSSQWFIPGNSVVFCATTGRDVALDLGDGIAVVHDTFGYAAIGTPTGESVPGKVLKLFPFEDKPPRIKGEAWCTSLPVITEPEAIAVLNNIS